jgi:lipopolysaccharide export system protein LptA
MCISNKWRLAFSIAALCTAASAWALNSDKNQPINIQSDHGDFLSNTSTNNGTGTYTGNVVITQGSIRITADKAVLHMSNGEIQTADITGTPATFQQQPDSGPLASPTRSPMMPTTTKWYSRAMRRCIRANARSPAT